MSGADDFKHPDPAQNFQEQFQQYIAAQKRGQDEKLKKVWQFLLPDERNHPFKSPTEITPSEKRALDSNLEKHLYTMLAKNKKHYMVDFLAVLALLYTSAFGLGYFASQWGFTGNGWPTLYTVVMGIMFIVAIMILWTGSFGQLPENTDRDRALFWIKSCMVLTVVYFGVSGFYYAFAYYGINGGNYDNLSPEDCDTVTSRIDTANSIMKYGLIAVVVIHIPLYFSLKYHTKDDWKDRYNFADAEKDVKIKNAFSYISNVYNLEESIKDIVEANNENEWLPHQ